MRIESLVGPVERGASLVQGFAHRVDAGRVLLLVADAPRFRFVPGSGRSGGSSADASAPP
jgi:hypothetical protein